MVDKNFELKSEKHSFTNQVASDSKYFNQDINIEELRKNQIHRNKIEASVFYNQLYNKYRKIIHPPIIVEKLKKMMFDKIVVYEVVGEDTKFSVDLLIEMLGSKGINNTIDSGRPRLFYNGHFFEVGTEFRLKDGELMTRDTNSFGYRFKDGEVVGTINWVDLD